MRDISLEELLEAGCHFGHQVNRQNPRAREFIFEARNNVHIIDLAKTKEGLEAAAAFVKALASQGGTIIFVGTKRQAKSIIKEEAKRSRSASSGQAGVFYVDERWIGGTLTNFEEITKNFKKLKDLRAKLQDKTELAKYTKRETGLWHKKMLVLERFYGGIEDLAKLPDTLFIVDTHLEEAAVAEARKLGLIIVGIVDTNSDPTIIDYPIPANDDAVGSIKLIVSYIADAWIEGKKQLENRKTATTETQKDTETLKKDAIAKKPKKGTKTRKKSKDVSKN